VIAHIDADIGDAALRMMSAEHERRTHSLGAVSELNHPKIMRTNVIGFVWDSSSTARTLHQRFRGPHHHQVLTCPVVPKTSTRRFLTVCERRDGFASCRHTKSWRRF